MKNLSRIEILKLLKELDSLITAPLEIIIGGGAAGILAHKYNRGTMDIDVISSIPKLSNVKNAIKSIAEKYDFSEEWLNDGVKGFVDYLPDDFRNRLITLKNGFNYLQVFSLSKIDLLIMKLVAFRAEDLQDINNMGIDDNGLTIIKEALPKIASFDKKKAYIIEMFLKERNLIREL